MIINRHNYEEFFLLYVDNELGAEERAAVERFVSQNPDIAKELDMLRQATLTEDNIQFEQKELLYKREDSISLNNYEEYFLLFADDELKPNEKAEVENFVLKHPELQNEFTLLQQARLQPEVIAFAGKELLYRKEKKSRRTIPFIMIRMGAAAAIVGIVYFSFSIIHTNKSIDKIIVADNRKPLSAKIAKSNTDSAKQLVTETQLASLQAKKESRHTITPGVTERVRIEKVDTPKAEAIKSEEKNLMVDKAKPETEVSNSEEVIEKTDNVANEPEVAVIPQDSRSFNEDDNSVSVKPKEENTLAIHQPVAKKDQPVFSHAVYLETESVEEERNLYIGSAEINKNKLKGLLKKAAVLFDKKIRRNEE